MMDFLQFIREFNLSYSQSLVKYEKLYNRRDYTIVNIGVGRIITFWITEDEINGLLGISKK